MNASDFLEQQLGPAAPAAAGAPPPATGAAPAAMTADQLLTRAGIPPQAKSDEDAIDAADLGPPRNPRPLSWVEGKDYVMGPDGVRVVTVTRARRGEKGAAPPSAPPSSPPSSPPSAGGPLPHPVAQAASGFNRGLAGVAGAPVDALTFLLNGVSRGVDWAAGTDTPPIRDPFGGSASIDRLFRYLGWEQAPETTLDRYIQAGGAGVGGAAGTLLTGGLAAPRLFQPLVRPFAAAPAATAAVTAGTGATSGLGSQAGSDAARAIDPANPWLDQLLSTAGGIAGGGAPLLAAAAARAPVQVVRALRAPTQRTFQEELAGRILNEASTYGAPIDLERPAVPGQPWSLPAAAGDPGLMALKNSMDRSSPAAQGRALAEASQGNQAVRQAAGAIEPAGQPAAVEQAQRWLEGQAAAAMQARADAALAAVDRELAAAGAGHGGTREAAGLSGRAELDTALRAARAEERAIWHEIDPGGSEAPATAPIRAAVDDYVAQLTAVRRGFLPADVMALIERLPQRGAVGEIADLRGALSNARRSLYAQHRFNEANAVGGLEDAFAAGMDRLQFADPQVMARYGAARRFSAQLNERFSRGPVRDALRNAPSGGPAVQPTRTLDVIARTPEGIRQFLEATGRSPQAVAAIRDHLLRDFESKAVRPNGQLNRPALERWLRDSGARLDEVDPSLRQRLQQAGTRQQALDQVIAENAATQDWLEQSAAHRFLGQEPRQAIAQVMGGGAPAARQLMRQLAQAPEAQAGVRRALVDWLLERSSGRPVDLEGDAVVSSGALDKLVRENRAAIAEILTPEQLQMLQRVQSAARSSQAAGRAMLPNSSTYANLAGERFIDLLVGGWAGRAIRGVQRIGGAAGAALGSLGGSAGAAVGAGVGEALGADLARGLYEKPRAQIMEILRRAIDEPEFGRQLMVKASRGNAQLAGPRFLGYLLGLPTAPAAGAAAARPPASRDQVEAP
jgi:hypothetical protein